jgi:molybdopterin-containing oxidoreductase family iron-sulfur binding subunit
MVHAINAALSNVGATVNYTDPIIDADTGAASLKALVDEINAGAVSMLVIADVNVAYSAPADLAISEALKKVPTVVHFGLYNDETAALATWHIHATHYLESWGDTRAFNGAVSLQQPLIAPLYEGKHFSEVLDALDGKRISAHDAVKGYWQAQLGLNGFAFEKVWQTALHDGIVAGVSALGSTQVTLGSVSAPAVASSDGLEADLPCRSLVARWFSRQ